ncbi:hypothetical protein CDL15_Pgr001120 [Punica granatum]|uniref:Uncharacterized protein n=1 Tax=Punica granatum TaxID=22663 RepID=A0A218WK39_PUNGR|nr:hypothetical protein CDL15_Pgr001120 [Punica granatum]
MDTLAKANFPPFGIDYPDSPTGSFTNGKNVADLIGLLVIDQRCCSIGKNHGFLTCVPHLTPCKNRDWYVIQDAYHRTEAAYLLLVKKFGNKARSYTYPYDYPPASRAINETPVSKISRSFNKEFTNYV